MSSLTGQLIVGQPAKKNVRVLAILMALVIAIGGSISFAPSASADTGGYPYASYNGPGTDPSQSWWTDSSSNGYSGYGYAYRNCTDYVAWKLQSLGVADTKTRGLGNGNEWASRAAGRSGVTVDSTPAYGAAAVQTSGTYGHVAFVQSVNTDGTITVSEYNHGWPLDGNYGTRTGTASALGFVSFVHFGISASTGLSSSITGDNKADLIWYEAWSNNGQAKVIGTNSSGNGAAFSNAWFSGYAAPTWAGLGDFNGDGKTDLAWYESWNNGTLKVLFSNGSGFSSSVTWFSGFSAPKWADVGDFTGDGKDDIAWYEDWNNGGTLKVIPTNANGNGPNASITWFSGYSAPDWADVGDLTGDGKDDIGWYESWNNGSLKVLVTNNSGSGVASGNVWFSGYSKPTWAAIGNFSGDNKKDIAWYEDWNSGGKLSVLPSNGGGFNSSITWFTGFAKPTRAFAADFNGDGRDDIGWYEASQENGRLKVIPTKSDGTGTQPTITWFTGYAAPTWAAAG